MKWTKLSPSEQKSVVEYLRDFGGKILVSDPTKFIRAPRNLAIPAYTPNDIQALLMAKEYWDQLNTTHKKEAINYQGQKRKSMERTNNPHAKSPKEKLSFHNPSKPRLANFQSLSPSEKRNVIQYLKSKSLIPENQIPNEFLIKCVSGYWTQLNDEQKMNAINYQGQKRKSMEGRPLLKVSQKEPLDYSLKSCLISLGHSLKGNLFKPPAKNTIPAKILNGIVLLKYLQKKGLLQKFASSFYFKPEKPTISPPPKTKKKSRINLNPSRLFKGIFTSRSKNDQVEMLNEMAQKFQPDQQGLIHTAVICSTIVLYIGDTHGDLATSKMIFACIATQVIEAGGTIVLLGDYVDRGKKSLENFTYWVRQKLKYPNQIIMLRGNHEDESIMYNEGHDWYHNLCEYHPAITSAISEIIDQLPISAIRLAPDNEFSVGLAAHGGSMFPEFINPSLGYMAGSDFSPENDKNSPLWNQFLYETTGGQGTGRNAGIELGKKTVDALKHCGINYLIAGHIHKNQTLYNFVHTIISTGGNSEDAYNRYKQKTPSVIIDNAGKLVHVNQPMWNTFDLHEALLA